MITTTYNYSSGTGFVYDSALITFGMGHALLSLQTNPFTFTPTISSSTYDHSLLQYLSGSLNQINLSPANSTFYAAWSSTINGNWGGGTLTGTAFNGAAVSGGYLDLTGTSGKYVDYSATGNADSPQTGAVKFKLTPNYSAVPATFQIFWATFNVPNSTNNNIQLYHEVGSGRVHLLINDSSGAAIANQILGVWSPVAGTEYEFELDWDITAGATRLFIDGVQFGSTVTQTGVRSASLIMRIGAEYIISGVVSANFKIRQLTMFSAVQHTSDYTPGYSYSDTLYGLATANLPAFSYGGMGAVSAFTSFAATDSGGVQYTLGSKYWNGSVWVVSDGSYAQSNPASVVNAHLAAFTPSSSLQINSIYPASNSQASMSAVSLGYNEQVYPISNPSIAPNAPLTMDQLTVFTAVLSASGSDGVQFYLRIGSSNYWWSGSAWSISNGTYAQSNTAADIEANAATLPISLGSFVTPYALLHSASGDSTPTLTSITLTYEYFGPEPTPPNFCEVFGYIFDEKGIPLNGAIVSVTNNTTFNNSGLIYAQGIRTATTDSIGYFSINLVETETLTTPEQITLDFDVRYTQTQVGTGFSPLTYSFGSAIIPNSASANITDLTFV